MSQEDVHEKNKNYVSNSPPHSSGDSPLNDSPTTPAQPISVLPAPKKKHSRQDEKLILDLKTSIPEVGNLFNIHRRIGEGTFSTVFQATLKCHAQVPMLHRKQFAIKHLIPTSHPTRIEKELKCLLEVGGLANVVGVELCLRNLNSVAFVMPYMHHDRFSDYFDIMTPLEVQTYMKNLLTAIQHVHQFNIVHRDVKPSNFLHNRKTGKFLLVDFGLSQKLEQPKESSAVQLERWSTTPSASESLPSPLTPPPDSGVSSTIAATLPTANNKRKLEEIETENTSNVNPPSSKRFRPSSMPAVPNGVNAVAAASDVESDRRNGLISFKEPLKQLNEQATPMGKNQQSIPLNTHVKSIVLAHALADKIEKRKLANIRDQSVAVKQQPPREGRTLARQNGDTSAPKRSHSPSACGCYGRPTVCNHCIVKKEIQASRAGTPGYRPPEVLFKYPDQTTAVDVWAAGVIFVVMLSRVISFFKPVDDYNALAEIITVFGFDRVKNCAAKLGRNILASNRKKPLHLRKLCIRFRKRMNRKENSATEKAAGTCDNCEQIYVDCLCAHTHTNTNFEGDLFPGSAYDLLSRLMELDPHKRITAEEALNHPFFSESFL